MNPLPIIAICAVIYPLPSPSWDENGLPKKQPRERYAAISPQIFKPLPEEPKAPWNYRDPFVNHALQSVSGGNIGLVETQTGQVFRYKLGVKNPITGITITKIIRGKSWIDTLVYATDGVITVAMGYDRKYLALRKKPEVQKPERKRPVYWVIPAIIVEKPQP